MSAQRTLSSILKTSAGVALLVLLGHIDAAAAQSSCPFDTTARQALSVLETIFLTAASQSLTACVLDLVQNLVWILAPLWVLLGITAGAVLLQAAFARKVAGQHNPSKFF